MVDFSIFKYKKGFFFTFIIVTFASLILLSSVFIYGVQERTSLHKRIGTMNSYIESMDEDFGRRLYIAEYRALFVMSGYIAEKGKFFNNTQATFRELFFNGTINGEPQELMSDPINGADYNFIMERLNEQAGAMQVRVNFTSINISLKHISPWIVRLNFSANIKMEDLGKLASWNTSFESIADVPIYAFEDPVYLANTGGKISHVFTPTPFATLLSFDCGATYRENLTAHLSNNTYFPSSDAPSFLQRLEGNMSRSAYGIESLVDLGELSAQGIAVSEKSVVDYIYFDSTNNPTPLYNIPGMPSWFKLDQTNKDEYCLV